MTAKVKTEWFVFAKCSTVLSYRMFKVSTFLFTTFGKRNAFYFHKGIFGSSPVYTGALCLEISCLALLVEDLFMNLPQLCPGLLARGWFHQGRWQRSESCAGFAGRGACPTRCIRSEGALASEPLNAGSSSLGYTSRLQATSPCPSLQEIQRYRKLCTWQCLKYSL